ncbi:MAG: DUF2092 domain-containing protein [Hyphomicrobiaceae bacterium]
MTSARSILTIIVLLTPLSCWAQQTNQPAQAELKLRQMHESIRQSHDLEFNTSFRAVDEVLGQTRTGTVHYQIRQPRQLRVTAKVSKSTIVVVSDGTILTIHEPNKRRYREFEAKESILGSLYTAAGLLGAQVRLIDFFWSVDFLSIGGDRANVERLEAKSFDGRTCDGVRVERGNDVWDVWIERTSARRPCHLISRTKDGSALMTQTNTIRWTANPAFNAETFRFTAPAGHNKE